MRHRTKLVAVCTLLVGGGVWRVGSAVADFWQRGGVRVVEHWPTYWGAPSDLREQNSLGAQYEAYRALRAQIQSGDVVAVDVVANAAEWQRLNEQVQAGRNSPELSSLLSALLFSYRMRRLLWPTPVHMTHQARAANATLWISLDSVRSPGPEFRPVPNTSGLRLWRK